MFLRKSVRIKEGMSISPANHRICLAGKPLFFVCRCRSACIVTRVYELLPKKADTMHCKSCPI